MFRRRNGKYNAKKTECSDGTICDSKREAARYEQLLILQRIGDIRDLQRQVSFELVPDMKHFKIRGTTYRADFTYVDLDGIRHVEDAKGMKTPEYKIKRKLMAWKYGILVEEV